MNKMKAGVTIGLVSFVLLSGAYIVNAKFVGERKENQVLAQDESMQNTWAMTSNQMKMNGLTVKNYTESDLKKLEIGMKRYADKPQMMMQWAQEQGNNLSPVLHAKLMDVVNLIAAKKEARQATKISVSQSVRDWSKSTLQGTVAGIVWSLPSAETHKIMDRIISNKATKQTWDTGMDEVKDPFAS